MSGGFPLKCDFCVVDDCDSAVRNLFAVLVDEYGFLVNMPPVNVSKAVSSVFHLHLGVDNRITKSVQVFSNGVISEDVLRHVRAQPCVRVESRLMVEGRALESQLTLCRLGKGGRLSINVIFLRPEQLLTPVQDDEFVRGLRELLIDVAIGAGSSGFRLDHFLDEDPDIECVDSAAIAEHLGRTTETSKRTWRGRNRPGLLVAAREGLVPFDALRNAWGPTANLFASRGFVGLCLIGS